MPYKLVLIKKNNKKEEIKPLCFDNPLNEFGFEDRKIERKASIMAKKIKKLDDVINCYVENY